MPGDIENLSYREAREAGRLQEWIDEENRRKFGPPEEKKTETDAFVREQVAPGSVLAAKEFQANARLEAISIRVKGVVAERTVVEATLERDGQSVKMELPISEGTNTLELGSLVEEFRAQDLLELTLVAKGDDVSPVQRVITTFVVTHD